MFEIPSNAPMNVSTATKVPVISAMYGSPQIFATVNQSVAVAGRAINAIHLNTSYTLLFLNIMFFRLP